MNLLNKLIKYGLYLFVFLLPWQTRWIFKEASINGEVWEYGRWSLYGTEIVLIIILGLGALAWLIQFIKMNHQRRITEIKNEFKGIRLWIILLVIWSALVIYWSLDKGLAWYGWLKLVEGVGLFWLIANIMRIDRELIANKSRIFLKTLSHVFIASGVVQALLGISQFMRQVDIAGNKWLGMSFIGVTTLGTSVIEFLNMRWLRAYGSLPHPNILAGFLVICLLLVIINLWQQKQKNGDANFKILFWLAAVVIFLGLILTFSRGAWLAFFICFSAGFIYWAVKKVKALVKLNLVLIILFCFTFAFIWTSYPSLLFTTRFSTEARLEEKSMNQRLAGYKQVNILLKDEPIKGIGINNYTIALYQKDDRWPGYLYQPVHDAGLLTLVELGIPGLLFFILIILSALRNRSEYILLLLAIMIMGLFDHYLRSLYFGIMLVWLVLAMNIGSTKEY